MRLVGLFARWCRKTLHAIIVCAEQNSTNRVDGKMGPCADSFHILAVASMECKDSGVHGVGDFAQLYVDPDGDAEIYQEHKRGARGSRHCSKTPSIRFEVAWSL